MKALQGSASVTVDASPQQSMTLLADIDRYPQWARDVVRDARVEARDDAGQPSLAAATLHVAVGPLVRDFHVRLDVRVGAETVRLVRIPHEASDPEELEVSWDIGDGPPTRIAVELEANLSVPRLLPVGGVGDAIATQLAEAAKAALSG